MEKNETVASFFTKISQVRDRLISIGVVVDEDDILQISIDGIPSPWDIFLDVVNNREVQPKFKRLWHDFLKEDGRVQRNSMCTKEENISLMERMKKGNDTFA